MQIQLFVSLTSLPIIISWGLPFSLLTPLGNIIFLPFVLLFLGVSSLIFFFELLHLPNAFFIFLLDKISCVWIVLMKYITFNPLIGFVKPHIMILCVLPLITFVLLSLDVFRGLYKSTGMLFGLFVCAYVGMNILQHAPPKHSTCACNKGMVHVFYNGSRLTVIDSGVMGRTKGVLSWFAYTLMPHIAKTTGKTDIDSLVLLKPTKWIEKELQEIIECARIQNICVLEQTKSGLGKSRKICQKMKVNYFRIYGDCGKSSSMGHLVHSNLDFKSVASDAKHGLCGIV